MASHSDEERFYMVQELCLRSTKFLHDVFRRRWEADTGTVWEDDYEHRKMFLDGPGFDLYKAAAYHHKTILCTTKVEEWDLLIITYVLSQYQSSINYQHETPAVDVLCSMGIFVTSKQPQAISKWEYDEKIELISGCLKILGMEEADVQTWIEEVESKEISEAFKQMEDLFNVGRCYEDERLMEEASNYYSDAINIPNLLPVHVALAYKKRACFCLRDNLKVDLALMNINESLSINNYSGSANYCAAECYRIKNLVSLAAYYYERAVVICADLANPELSEYTQSPFTRTLTDYDKPSLMPMTGEEYEKIVTEENIYMDTIIPKAVVKVSKNFTGPDAADSGYEHAMEGFKYYYGWDVGQDFEKAVEHFRKSADCKNAAGTAALAKCYLNGHGVAKDSKEAYTIFMEATKLCKTWPGLSTSVRGDHGVAEAQHALGRMHFDKHEFDLAADWYKRSMENGHGHSATIYGNMVTWGVAKEINIKLGKMCWKEGVNLKDPMALKWLLRYYLNELEPDLAQGYYMYGRAAKNPIISNWHEKPFNELITGIRKYRGTAEDELVRFERDYKLTLKDLTFMERLNRVEYYSDLIVLRLESFLQTNPNSEMAKEPTVKLQKLTEEMIKEINRRAQTGVQSAKKLKQMLKCANNLREIFKGGKELTEDEGMMKVMKWYYKIVTTNEDWIDVLDLPKEKIKSNIESLWNNEKNQEEGPTDEKLRICLALQVDKQKDPSKNDMVLQTLKKGVERYPNNMQYYIIISLLSKRYGDVQTSLHYTEEGLKIDPNNADLLLRLAVLSHETPRAGDCIEKYYRKFTTAAPKDHPLFPSVWYTIASLQWQTFIAAKDNYWARKDSAYILKECLGKAAEAESHQLPCYLTNNWNSMSSRIRAALEKDVKDELKWRKQTVSAVEKSKTLFERKHYLKSPTRQLLVRFHRRDLKKLVMMTSEEREMSSFHEKLVPTLMKQSTVKNVSLLTPITLQEMNVVDSYCFENRKIDLTVLDDSFNSAISINCVVEDNNGDVIRLHIYNVDLTEESAKRFSTGTRLAVMNPCMIVENGQKHDWLRVDGLEYIKFLGGVKQMCGFCGETNASHRCPSCSRLYCESKCLQLDKERHDHELICLRNPNPKKKGKK